MCISVCVCASELLHLPECTVRACGHHLVHLTVGNKLEVKMIILFVVWLVSVCAAAAAAAVAYM